MTLPSWATTAVNQSPGAATDYPFVRPSDDIKYALSDLWLAYADHGYKLPFRVAWMYGFGATAVANPLPQYTPTNTADLVIVDADDAVVFDSTQVVSTTRAWTTGLTIMQWVLADAVLRLNYRTTMPPWALSFTRDDYIEPVNGVLDGRTYYRLPKRVRSLRLGLDTLEGAVSLVAGNNVNMSLPAVPRVDGNRRINRVTIRAKAGDGTGRIAGCEDTVPAIKRINTVGATAGGDFLLSTADCYRIQRPTTMTSLLPREATLLDPNTLQLFNNCMPCCECDDFVRTYKGLSKLWDKYLALGNRAEDARDQLQDNIYRWENQRTCRTRQNLRLTLSGEPRCHLFIGGLHCNMSKGCITNVTLRLTIDYGYNVDDFTDVATKLCRDTRRSGSDTHYEDIVVQPNGTHPVYDFPFSRVDTQSTSRIRTRLGLFCDANTTAHVALTAHFADGAGVDVVTGAVITYPEVEDTTLPAWVTDIWADGHPKPAKTRSYLIKEATIGKKVGCEECG